MKHVKFLIGFIILAFPLSSFSGDGWWLTKEGLYCEGEVDHYRVTYDIYFDTYKWGKGRSNENDHPAMKESVFDVASGEPVATKIFGYRAMTRADESKGFNPALDDGGVYGFPHYYNIVWAWAKRTQRLGHYMVVFQGFFGSVTLFHEVEPDYFEDEGPPLFDIDDSKYDLKSFACR